MLCITTTLNVYSRNVYLQAYNVDVRTAARAQKHVRDLRSALQAVVDSIQAEENEMTDIVRPILTWNELYYV